MEKKKENAVNDFITMIKRSWTWERLTPQERHVYLDRMDFLDRTGKIKGRYEDRWAQAQELYTMFIDGAGAHEDHWREGIKYPAEEIE